MDAIWAFSANFIVAVVVSLFTKPRPESELVGLVHSLTPKPPHAHLPLVEAARGAGMLRCLLGAVAPEHFLLP